MGVHGLWKLIDSSGKPIPLEALENRILAVDVSIWLYQLVKGFQESAGHSVANAYLLGLFHRICKLLFYRIKPIFVFDGGVPALKRRTIVYFDGGCGKVGKSKVQCSIKASVDIIEAERQHSRSKSNLLSEKLRQTLLENLAKQEALGKALGESVVLPKMFQPKQDSLFELPPLPSTEEDIEIESDSEEEEMKYRYKDIHSIDVTSEEFLSLPADMRHDILNELKETRKQSSWAKLHLMPKVGDEFSDFQMRRLLKRRAVQVGIEQAESEMGTRGFTISDLQSILSDQGVEVARRIAADSSTRLLYNNKIKEIANAKIKNDSKDTPKASSSSPHRSAKRIKKEKFSSSSSEGSMSETYDEDEDLDLEQTESSLSQAEILELIKRDNQTSSQEKKNDSVSPAAYLVDLMNVKTEGGDELSVNGEAVENETRNNELKLGHGSLPREDDYCGSSSSSCLQDPGACSLSQALPDTQHSLGKEKKIEKVVNLEMKQEPMDVTGKEQSLIASDESTEELFKKPEIPEVKIEIKQENTDENEASNTNVKSPPNIKNISINNEQIDSDEESDDDFVEIDNSEDKEITEDIPLTQSKDLSDIKQTSSNSIEIVVQSVNTLDDDLFADVFSNSNESKNPSNSVHITKLNKENNKVKYSIVKDDFKASKTPPKLTETNDNSSPKNIEIVINSGDSLEDDMFADVFNSDDIKNIDVNDESTEGKSNPGSAPITSHETEQFIEDLETNKIFSDYQGKKRSPSPVPQLSVDEIMKMKKDLEKESSHLFAATSKEERNASTITEQIRLDAQELLHLFGIPYIISPMEAEAQCAYLDLSGQTQGTITDDSDIWLFGGKNVYKNFFDQKKFVLQFKSTDITRCLHMERDEMIMLALLSGSDYTLGLTGVGAVTALEVIAHYPKSEAESSPVERLKRFAKELKTKALDPNIAKKLKKASLSEGFPSPEVVKAYLDPEIDKSSEAFTWSKPNIKEIKRYAREKFGWDPNRTDKVLEPILTNLQKTQTQGTLHNFFEWKFDGIEKTRSKRVENAINLLKTPSLLTAPSPSKTPSRTKTSSVSRNVSRKKTPSSLKIPPLTETPDHLLEPGPSSERPPIRGNMKYAEDNLPMKSKTPAQIAREKAAKKFQELKKQGKIGPKSKRK